MLILIGIIPVNKPFLNFNTSHVNVNPKQSTRLLSLSLISIHLMLMLIFAEMFFFLVFFYFNTSHVNVNQGGGYGSGTMPAFQYISC